MKIHKNIKIYLNKNKIYIEDIINRKYVYALSKDQVINIIDKVVINDILPDGKKILQDDTVILEYERDCLYKTFTGFSNGDQRTVDAYLYKLVTNESTINFDAKNFLFNDLADSENDNRPLINIDEWEQSLEHSYLNNVSDMDKGDEQRKIYNYISYAIIVIAYDKSDNIGVSADTDFRFVGQLEAKGINDDLVNEEFNNICDIQCFE